MHSSRSYVNRLYRAIHPVPKSSNPWLTSRCVEPCNCSIHRRRQGWPCGRRRPTRLCAGFVRFSVVRLRVMCLRMVRLRMMLRASAMFRLSVMLRRPVILVVMAFPPTLPAIMTFFATFATMTTFLTTPSVLPCPVMLVNSCAEVADECHSIYRGQFVYPAFLRWSSLTIVC